MKYDLFPCVGDYRVIADRMMAAGQAEGAITTERSALTDRHQVLIARHATQDGYLVAGISVFGSPDEDMLWLDILYVAPEFRRQGIGAELVRRTHALAAAAGLKTFGLGTLVGNQPMIALITRALPIDHFYFYADLPSAA